MDLRRHKSDGPLLLCFNPTVMLATFIIEAFLVLLLFVRYKLTPLIRFSLAIVVCLAVFQLAEYAVCEGNPAWAPYWSRAGFVAITLLPVFGAHAAYHLTESKNKRLLSIVTLFGVGFASVFLFGDVFGEPVCGGNYIIFNLNTPIGGWFFVYYYALLLGTIIWTLRAAHEASRRLRDTLHMFIASYFSFIVPSAIVTVWRPITLNGLPSIMCGFALLFALLYTLLVIPRVQQPEIDR